MKICYLAFIRLPTEKAHGVQIMKTCEALADLGVELELMVPGRKTPITEDARTYYAVRNNFVLTSLNTPDWVRFGFLGYILSAIWFSEAAKWKSSFWAADAVYSRDALVLVQFFFLGRRLVYEAHTKPTFLSRFVARHAHHVVVISEGLRDAYVAAGIAVEKITVAHDAIDETAFEKPLDRNASRERLGIPLDKVVALYVGRIDVPKGAGTMARAAEALPDTHVGVLIGSGPIQDLLKRTYPKALVLAETPYRELPSVLAAADILVAPNSALDADASRFTSPLKAFAYLAAKKPIIASDVPALRVIFQDDVRYMRPDNPEDLVKAILDPKTLQAVPRVKPFSWRDRASIIKSALHDAP